VVVSEGTTRLAGRLDGVHFSDRGRVSLKNIPDPVRIYHAYMERDAPHASRPVLMFFSKPARTLGWKLGLLVVLLAAATAATVVYFTTGDHTEGGNAAENRTLPGQAPAGETSLAANAGLDAIVPAAIWKDCRLQTVPELKAVQTAVCLPSNGMPDRWEISSYRNSADLTAAYDGLLRGHANIERDTGRCNAFVWGGEYEWNHGKDKPGGRAFCYFDGNDAVIVWDHQRLGQPTHRDVLLIAREGGSDHVGLTRWWRPWHHLIGKAQ
jgi:hypothetical protein